MESDRSERVDRYERVTRRDSGRSVRKLETRRGRELRTAGGAPPNSRKRKLNTLSFESSSAKKRRGEAMEDDHDEETEENEEEENHSSKFIGLTLNEEKRLYFAEGEVDGEMRKFGMHVKEEVLAEKVRKEVEKLRADGHEVGPLGEPRKAKRRLKLRKKKVVPVVKSESAEPDRSSPPLVVKRTPRIIRRATVVKNEPKKFVTMRQLPPAPSSSEDESDSDSDSDGGWVGPKLEVQAQHGALILVRNLPPEVTGRNLLFELFAKFPAIEQVSIHTDKNGGSLGTAEVAVSTVAQAKDVIRRCKNVIYRNHEIYMTMMGTSTIAQTAAEVIEPLPKELRRKDRKRRKKDREQGERRDRERDRDRSDRRERDEGRSSRSDRSRRKKERAEEEEAAMEDVDEDVDVEEVEPEPEPEPQSPPPKPRKLRIQSPVAIVPETRPWNWGGSKPSNKNYDEEYIPPTWEENDETYYHVTMKKELQQHLPNLAGQY